MSIRISYSQLSTLIRESITRVLSETHSQFLYHFMEFYRFKQLAQTNTFVPSDFEKSWNRGRNAISLSRTKTFREGWPVIMYSGDDGKGDDWCAIRLTLDGDLIQRKPNFKLDGKQHNIQVKPFDWAYKENNNGDPFTFADEYDGVFAHNGKEWMQQSDEYSTSYLPIKTNGQYYNGVSDKQGHPYSQAEDRLTTNAPKIPNANQYILRVDILLLPWAFNKNNLGDRKELLQITTSSVLKGKIHLYTDMKNLEMERNELKNLSMLQNEVVRGYKTPIPFAMNVKKDF